MIDDTFVDSVYESDPRNVPLVEARLGPLIGGITIDGTNYVFEDMYKVLRTEGAWKRLNSNEQGYLRSNINKLAEAYNYYRNIVERDGWNREVKIEGKTLEIINLHKRCIKSEYKGMRKMFQKIMSSQNGTSTNNLIEG